jgi:Tat protein translocase TatB subunit
MFGIGYQEMFVILVVAMVIFGPSRLPEMAGQVGRWVRDFRRMSADLTGEFDKTFAEVDEIKRTFTREMQSIQDEVEGVGKSTRGDLRKSGKKSQPGGRKAVGAGGKTARSTSTAGSGRAATASAARPGASVAQESATNGARTKMPGLEPRKRSARAGKNGGALNPLALPLATKEDPLADVSFFDLDAELVVVDNGAAIAGNGVSAESDEALSRVRRRRASASYARSTV